MQRKRKKLSVQCDGGDGKRSDLRGLAGTDPDWIIKREQVKRNVEGLPVDELAKERYDLAVERIREIREEKTVAEPYLEFFTKTAGFLEEMIRLRDRVEAGEMKKLSLEELRRENTQCYQDILPENYPTSYASPDYAAKILGEELGVLLSFLYTELRGMIVYAWEQKEWDFESLHQKTGEHRWFHIVAIGSVVNGKKLHISGGDYQLCDGKNVFCCNRLCKRSEESVRKIIIQRKVGAQTALKEAGIRLYGGVKGNADKAIEAYLKGNLDYNPEVHCTTHEHGHSCGEHHCGEEKHGCSGNGENQ